MAFGGCIVGFTGCYFRDGQAIRDRGFLQGYTPFTVFLVVFSASGGLIIAVAVKYADNIYKVGFDQLVVQIPVRGICRHLAVCPRLEYESLKILSTKAMPWPSPSPNSSLPSI